MQCLGLGKNNVIANQRQPSKDNTKDVHSKPQIGHSVAARSLSDGKPTTSEAQTSSSTDCPGEILAPRLLETRILIAMYNLQLNCRSLLAGVCHEDDAAQASKCLQLDYESVLDDDGEVEDVDETEWEEEQEAEFDRLLRCLNCYEEELDAMTDTTEDSAIARDKEMDHILSELKEEEASLRSLMNMAVAIREQQQVEEEGNNDKSSAPVLISGSDNEGRHQCFSPMAPTCRHCGGSHWKYRCPSFMQGPHLFQANTLSVGQVEI
ncbi:hypothetical protein IV203_028008 [Nitzschia inconspicua]|uniref:Uncharacterized protein n=1 Tax=Nitzschia inconspicua TaxID=303405 RepID=A0A9K3LXQ7_9STRA|nr:hypothetical protein IV203_028008 [Nitzschia inconspicua]